MRNSRLNKMPAGACLMKKLYQAIFAISVIAVLTTATTLTVFGAPQSADRKAEENNNRQFSATLSGFNETPQTLFSSGTGTFTATLSDDGTSLTFTLTYTGLIGASAAHIHLGAPATSGGVAVFLCGGPRPSCPASSGTATGTITAADIISPAVGPVNQGLTAGNFAGLIASMRAGATYVNVHTAAHGGGEIRGQITSDED